MQTSTQPTSDPEKQVPVWNKKRFLPSVKRILYVCLITLLPFIGIYGFGKADNYFREVINQAIENQIEQRRDEIDAQIQANLQQALKDEKTQREVQIILQRAVAAELEENGESHLRQVIERRAPHAIPFLFPESKSTSRTSHN